MKRSNAGLVLASALLLALPFPSSAGAGAGRRERTPVSVSAIPPGAAPSVRFEENRGQSDPSVRFIARGRGYTGFLTDRGLVLSLPGVAPPSAPPRDPGGRPGRARITGLSMEFVGGSAKPVGSGMLPGYSSHLVGRERSRWVRRTPSFGRVQARGVWPGIDADWTSEGGILRYSFRASRGADPSTISLRFEGASGARIDRRGDLLLDTGFGTLRHSRPEAWQESGGIRTPVEAAFVLRAPGVVGFRFGTLDPRLPLVVDPRIDYSTYLGGAGYDDFTSVATDASGAVYLLGSAGSSTLPIVGGFRGQAQFAVSEVYLAKFAADGATLGYATFLGGSDDDYGNGVAVDSSGRAWVSGGTLSSDFPTASPFQASRKGYYDAFATRVSAAGDAVEVSTYFGGATSVSAESPGTMANGVAVDSSGDAYIVGTTDCSNLPTKDPFQGAHGGLGYNAFIAKITAAGGLSYASYLGGNTSDYGRSVAVDGQGRAYVVGFNGGGTFPTVNALPAIKGGGADAFLCRVSSDGKSLEYSFRWGGSVTEDAYAVRLGPGGDVYVVGTTGSSDFPVVSPLMTVTFGSSGYTAAFLSRFSGDGTSLQYSTLLGGNQAANKGYALAVDGAGGAWVGGETNATSFFPKVNALQTSYAGGVKDAFVMRLNSTGSVLRFSTYLGGNNGDSVHAIALAGTGVGWCAGTTNSTTFPTKDPLKASYGGGDADGFLTCFSFLPEAPTALAGVAISGTSASLSWTDNSTAETGFVLQRRTAGGAFATVGSVGAGVTAMGDGGLAPLTAYEYRVQAVNDEGGSNWSNVASVTTPDVPPAAPSLVSAVPLSPTSVRLTWTDNSANETSFEVLYGLPGTAHAVIPGLPPGTTTHDVTGLFPARTYGFTVRGRNEMGVGIAPADLLATTDPTASFTLAKGTLKASAKLLKDKAVFSGTLAVGAASPDGTLDPVADGLVVRLGGEMAPLASVSIPAGSPGWKERKGKFTWKSAKGSLPKATVAFTPATGAFTVNLSKVDFAGLIATPLAEWFATGNDAGTGTADWQEAKPGSWRFPAK